MSLAPRLLSVAGDLAPGVVAALHRGALVPPACPDPPVVDLDDATLAALAALEGTHLAAAVPYLSCARAAAAFAAAADDWGGWSLRTALLVHGRLPGPGDEGADEYLSALLDFAARHGLAPRPRTDELLAACGPGPLGRAAAGGGNLALAAHLERLRRCTTADEAAAVLDGPPGATSCWVLLGSDHDGPRRLAADTLAASPQLLAEVLDLDVVAGPRHADALCAVALPDGPVSVVLSDDAWDHLAGRLGGPDDGAVVGLMLAAGGHRRTLARLDTLVAHLGADALAALVAGEALRPGPLPAAVCHRAAEVLAAATAGDPAGWDLPAVDVVCDALSGWLASSVEAPAAVLDGLGASARTSALARRWARDLAGVHRRGDGALRVALRRHRLDPASWLAVADASCTPDEVAAHVVALDGPVAPDVVDWVLCCRRLPPATRVQVALACGPRAAELAWLAHPVSLNPLGPCAEDLVAGAVRPDDLGWGAALWGLDGARRALLARTAADPAGHRDAWRRVLAAVEVPGDDLAALLDLCPGLVVDAVRGGRHRDLWGLLAREPHRLGAAGPATVLEAVRRARGAGTDLSGLLDVPCTAAADETSVRRLLSEVPLPAGLLAAALAAHPQLWPWWAGGGATANPFDPADLGAALALGPDVAPDAAVAAAGLLGTSTAGRRLVASCPGLLVTLAAAGGAAPGEALELVLELLHERLGDDALAWSTAAALMDRFPGSVDALCEVVHASTA